MSFYGLLRRSDIATLTTESIQYSHNKGYCLAHIVRSKTDQVGDGYTLPIILHCKAWSWEPDFQLYWEDRQATGGAWLPTYDARTKTVQQSKPLTKDAVGKVLTNRIREAQAQGHLKATQLAQFASHSLRRGGATFMQRNDAPEWLIKEMGRWKSEAFRLYTDPTWS